MHASFFCFDRDRSSSSATCFDTEIFVINCTDPTTTTTTIPPPSRKGGWLGNGRTRDSRTKRFAEGSTCQGPNEVCQSVSLVSLTKHATGISLLETRDGRAQSLQFPALMKRSRSSRTETLTSLLQPWSHTLAPSFSLYFSVCILYSTVCLFSLHPADLTTTIRDVDEDFRKIGRSGRVQWIYMYMYTQHRNRTKKKTYRIITNQLKDNRTIDTVVKNKGQQKKKLNTKKKKRTESAAIGMRGMSCFGCVGDKTF